MEGNLLEAIFQCSSDELLLCLFNVLNICRAVSIVFSEEH